MATEYREPVGDANVGSGSADLGAGVVDPAAVAAVGSEPVGDGHRTRKRRSDAGQSRGGRKSAGTTKASQKVALDLGAITGMFVGLHALLAERTDTPEIAITEDEGKQFMAAVQNVMRHYSVETTQKSLDWIALMGTASGMYVPRIAAAGVRRKMAKRGRPARPAPQQPAEGNVATIRPDMNGNVGFQGEA